MTLQKKSKPEPQPQFLAFENALRDTYTDSYNNTKHHDFYTLRLVTEPGVVINNTNTIPQNGFVSKEKVKINLETRPMYVHTQLTGNLLSCIKAGGINKATLYKDGIEIAKQDQLFKDHAANRPQINPTNENFDLFNADFFSETGVYRIDIQFEGYWDNVTLGGGSSKGLQQSSFSFVINPIGEVINEPVEQVVQFENSLFDTYTNTNNNTKHHDFYTLRLSTKPGEAFSNSNGDMIPQSEFVSDKDVKISIETRSMYEHSQLVGKLISCIKSDGINVAYLFYNEELIATETDLFKDQYPSLSQINPKNETYDLFNGQYFTEIGHYTIKIKFEAYWDNMVFGGGHSLGEQYNSFSFVINPSGESIDEPVIQKLTFANSKENLYTDNHNNTKYHDFYKVNLISLPNQPMLETVETTEVSQSGATIINPFMISIDTKPMYLHKQFTGNLLSSIVNNAENKVTVLKDNKIYKTQGEVFKDTNSKQPNINPGTQTLDLFEKYAFTELGQYEIKIEFEGHWNNIGFFGGGGTKGLQSNSFKFSLLPEGVYIPTNEYNSVTFENDLENSFSDGNNNTRYHDFYDVRLISQPNEIINDAATISQTDALTESAFKVNLETNMMYIHTQVIGDLVSCIKRGEINRATISKDNIILATHEGLFKDRSSQHGYINPGIENYDLFGGTYFTEPGQYKIMIEFEGYWYNKVTNTGGSKGIQRAYFYITITEPHIIE